MEVASAPRPTPAKYLFHALAFGLNLLLYFFVFGFSLLLGSPGSFAAALLYFFIGACSHFWSRSIFLTVAPAAIAFPVALGSFMSAVIRDDTQGQTSLSLWSSIRLIEREYFIAYIAAVIASAFGWLLVHHLLRNRTGA